LRSIILGAEAAKGYSFLSRDNETVFWRPAIINERDLSDYKNVLEYRREKAFIKLMGFFSSFDNQNVALQHLIQKHKELENMDK